MCSFTISPTYDPSVATPQPITMNLPLHRILAVLLQQTVRADPRAYLAMLRQAFFMGPQQNLKDSVLLDYFLQVRVADVVLSSPPTSPHPSDPPTRRVRSFPNFNGMRISTASPAHSGLHGSDACQTLGS